MKFTKMQGCGNDYIYINGGTERIADDRKPELVRRLSDRHFGIGGDGVIFINPAPASETGVDYEMEMYNADGSRSEMCGNGIRCVGAYVWEHGMTDRTKLTILSAGARKYLTLEPDDQAPDRRIKSVTVDMGAPILTPFSIPVDEAKLPAEHEKTNGLTIATFTGEAGQPGFSPLTLNYRTAFVSMGNPHAVIVLPDDTDLSAFPLEQTGRWFESHPCFPNRTNTEFVHIDGRNEVHMRVWERGTGETLACGTGCCAITVACALQGFTEDEILLHVLGGEIRCRYDRAADTVFMTGPAVTVFEGEINL
ncbi:MAG: diaminopimelate epimerase [Lachnospiraceae bacterium]|nr:diaminopimelate epimerase [Lachnospiraceae bacterium]